MKDLNSENASSLNNNLPHKIDDLEAYLREELTKRIFFLDGAMGTMIQNLQLDESDFRGLMFKDHPKDLKGNNDILVLTQPHHIRDIHLQYLQAGADFIETNTFSGTSIAQGDYQCEKYVYDLNVAAAKLAKEACNEVGFIGFFHYFCNSRLLEMGLLIKNTCLNKILGHNAFICISNR
jgi:S-methylmethionine-dependent homocysteine/selenocysteine methylase